MTSRPSVAFRSRSSERLPALIHMCHGIATSSVLFTLITSAPYSASTRPAVGPASTCVKSTTRTPSSGALASPVPAAPRRGVPNVGSPPITRGLGESGVRLRTTGWPSCAVGPSTGSTTSATAWLSRPPPSTRSHSSVVWHTAQGAPVRSLISDSHSAASRVANSSPNRLMSSNCSSGSALSLSGSATPSASHSGTNSSANHRMCRSSNRHRWSQRPSLHL